MPVDISDTKWKELKRLVTALEDDETLDPETREIATKALTIMLDIDFSIG